MFFFAKWQSYKPTISNAFLSLLSFKNINQKKNPIDIKQVDRKLNKFKNLISMQNLPKVSILGVESHLPFSCTAFPGVYSMKPID